MAIEKELRQAAPDANPSELSGRLAQAVDKYVMVVTEGLCALESRDRDVMERPDLVERKARILERLDVLDKLVAVFLRDVEREHPSGPDHWHEG